MSGFIVCSWSDNSAERARTLFDKACTGFGRFQGLKRASEDTAPTFRMARFASDKSPHPALVKSTDGRVVMAVTGWCFHPDKPTGDWQSVVAEFSQKRPSDWDGILDRFQGQYVVAIADRENGEVVVSDDQLGVFPLYTTEQDGVAWASTSSMALAYALGRRLDLEAFHALFMDDEIRSPKSAFEGIRRSLLGERHYLKNGKSRTRRVWIPFHEPTAYRTINDAVDEGIDVLQKTCQHIRDAWPRCVSDLTSGLDSRLVVSMMAKCGEPVHLTVNGRPQDMDVTVARRTSEKLHWPLVHNEYPLDWGKKRWDFFQRAVALTDGEKSGHALDRTLWAKAILSKSYDASTGGSGGEFWRDFWWTQEFARIGRTSDLNLRRLLRYRLTFNSKPDTNLFRSDWRAQYEDSQVNAMRDVVDLAPDALNSAKLDAIYIWYFSGHSGRIGAATFPTIASPFALLTADAMAYATAVPWKLRISGKLIRHIITRAHPQLASMPTWHGGSGEPLSLRRPVQYGHFHLKLLSKFARKFGQLTLKHALIPPPMVRRMLPVYDTDLVSALAKEGFLDVENLVTKNLYNTEYLKEFLQRARGEGFKSYSQLYTIVSIELVCRLCEMVPEGQSF